MNVIGEKSNYSGCIRKILRENLGNVVNDYMGN